MKRKFLLIGVIQILSLSSCGLVGGGGGYEPVNPSPSVTPQETTTEPTPQKYTVTWKNYDGTVLEIDQNVEYGTRASYDGATPERKRTKEFTYTFSDWSPSIGLVTSDQTYTAQFTSTKNLYTVTFVNYNNEVLQTSQVEYGVLPTYNGPTPERENTDKYVYTFYGWNKEIVPVVGDVTYKAWFSEKLKLYTVKFYDEDQTTLLQSGSFQYGSTPYFTGAKPTKADDDYFTYKFAHWDRDFEVVHGDQSYYAVYSSQPRQCVLTFEKNGGQGAAFGDTYDAGSKISNPGPLTKRGYEFACWACNGEPWDFENDVIMNDMTLEAIWTAKVYKLSYQLNGGVAPENNPTEYTIEDDVVLNDPISHPAYNRFVGWHTSGSFSDAAKKGWKPGTYAQDFILFAEYSGLKTFTIKYDLNGGSISTSNPSTYNYESLKIVLNEPTKEGYVFEGWFDEDGNKVVEINTHSYGNLVLTAEWSNQLNELTVSSSDVTKGIVKITNGTGYSFEAITVEATPANDCYFMGWYCGRNKIAEENIYTFEMPNGDYEIYALFMNRDEHAVEMDKIQFAKKPYLSIDGKTVTYGLYPQKWVTNSSLISTLNSLTVADSSNGWYLYEGVYYTKIVAHPCAQHVSYNVPGTIQDGTSYWFSCTPITWKVLSNDDGICYLLASTVLDAKCYSIARDNNYKNSTIRTFLLSEFYTKAFALNDDYIQTTEVDNSPSSTYSATNKYCCDNTFDKVFLPSYKDLINEDYGFETDPYSESKARRCGGTTYTTARGAWYYMESGAVSGNVTYWTRTPSNYSSTYAWTVNYLGKVYDYNSTDNSSYGVRPAIVVDLYAND